MTNLQLVPEPPAVRPETDHESLQAWVDSVNQRHAAERRALQNRINALVEQNAELQRQIDLRDNELALLQAKY